MDKNPARLLIVDDNENNRYTLGRRLRRQGFENIKEAVDGREALDILADELFDIVFLDLMMPNVDGFEVMEALRERDLLHKLPVIMISANDNVENIARGIEMGAVDYLPKPFDPVILRARVEATLEQKRLRDVEQTYLEHYDQETGLPNRRLFVQQLDQNLALARATDGLVGVLAVGLGGFKGLAATMGVAAGSQIFTRARMVVDMALDGGATVARIGEESLAIFILGVESETEIADVCRDLLSELKLPFELDGQEVAVSASAGMSFSSTGYQHAKDMLLDADLALSKAGVDGMPNIVVFDTAMHERVSKAMAVQVELRQALENDELELFYQPFVSLKTGRIIGAEGLIRWRHPTRGLVPPFEFIPIAEETDLILPIGELVIEQGCRKLADWNGKGFGGTDGLVLSVNVSPRQLAEQDLVGITRKAMAVHGIDRLKLELTESFLVHDPKSAAATLSELSALGATLALDDFGTGYSSLSYLHQFPFDTIKIDRAFVSRMQEDESAKAIVRAIIMMAHGMGMDVVAEGVEAPEELELLREFGCDIAQGFYMSKPLEEAAFDALVAEDPIW